MSQIQFGFSNRTSVSIGTRRRAFTLVEVLVVVAIIGLLITLLGSVVGMSLRKAREAATTTVLKKVDDALDARLKGFERATKSPDFDRIIAARKTSLEAAGVFGVSPKVVAAIARKDFFRQLFPQRYEDLPCVSSGPLTGVPFVFVGEDLNGNGTLDSGEDKNGNGVLDVLQPPYDHSKHKRETESSALLYYALTKMESFGVPAPGESEFSTSEYRDTDGDGLPEFVDGWGRPLRFYRWPTRLLKPNGPYGPDGAPGTGGSSFLAYGTVGTDDVALQLATLLPSPPPPEQPKSTRSIASLLIEGLAPAPAFPTTQWDPLSEDPDDPYGLISTEMKRLFASGVPVTASYNEAFYPTLDTYHTPLVVSAGPDGDLGLFEPFVATDTNGDGVLGVGDDLGILAQPIHGPLGAFYINDSAYTPLGNNVVSALADNLTNRNRRAGKGR